MPSQYAPPVDLTDKNAIVDYLIEAFTADPRFGYDGTGCVYRTSEGAACAFGRLIPDALYNMEYEDPESGAEKVCDGIEGDGVQTALNVFEYALRSKGEVKDEARQAWVNSDTHFLDMCQNIHDSHALIEEGPEGVAAMVQTYRSWKEYGYPSFGNASPRMRTWESI